MVTVDLATVADAKNESLPGIIFQDGGLGRGAHHFSSAAEKELEVGDWGERENSGVVAERPEGSSSNCVPESGHIGEDSLGTARSGGECP